MSQGGGQKGMENLGIAALGLFFAVCLLFMGTGALGARLLGHTTVANLNSMPQILTGVLSDPMHPNLAWPEADQKAVPGFFLFWLIFAILCGALVTAGVFLYRVFGDVGGGGGGGRKNSLGGKGTQWAKKSDMKTLMVRGPEPGRLVLGHVNGSLVATEQRHSVIVLGPTQSGKTTGLAVPSILEWKGPCIATSVKNDLAQDTYGWRERQGSIWVYDPTNTSGLQTATWSPLDGAREWSGAKKIASWLTSASKSGGKGGLSDGDFWYSAAGKLLAPHLFAAAANGYTMADVVRWIDTQEEFEVRSLLQATGVEEAITAAEASWQT